MKSERHGHILEFDEGRHRYKFDDKSIPGVTTFISGGYPISPTLVSWMVGQGAKYALEKGMQEPTASITRQKEIIKASKTAYKVEMGKAADIGSIVHDYAYYSETGQTDKLKDLIAEVQHLEDWTKIKHAIDSFDAWRIKNKDTNIQCEQIVAANGLNNFVYGGKFDRLSKRNGLWVLSDFKTSNAVYDKHWLQLAAYNIAISDWLDINIDIWEVLRFGKDKGDFDTPFLTDSKQQSEYIKQVVRCYETYQFIKAQNDDTK